MLRMLLIFICFSLVFVAVVLYLAQTPGIAGFSFGDVSIELPLIKFVIGLFVVFVIFYLLLRIFSLLFNTPKRIQAAALRRRRLNAINNTKAGVIKFMLGDWALAEKLLLRGVENTDIPYVNYVWAARAAHQSGTYQARDRYLDMAKKCAPEVQAAIHILQTEFLLEQGLPEQALANLSQRRDEIRAHPKIAMLFADAYVQLNAWEKLVDMLPELKKVKGLDKKVLIKTQKQAVQGLLRNCKNHTNAGDVEGIGSRFKETILADNALIISYIEALRAQKKYAAAATFIINLVEKNWNTEFVRQYGLLELDNPDRALKKAEQWTKRYTSDANLYLTLGRLCKRAQLWGKAKTYLESSLRCNPLAETYAELAALHEYLDELDEAHQCAKKGLRLATRIT